jgi:hypothetical protein
MNPLGEPPLVPFPVQSHPASSLFKNLVDASFEGCGNEKETKSRADKHLKQKQGQRALVALVKVQMLSTQLYITTV